MALRRWDPSRELRQMQDNMDRLWRSFGFGGGDGEAEAWSIPLDVVQEGDNIVVNASLPGVNPEDIDVSIENDVLMIKGHSREERERREGDYLMRERRTGSFHRALRLPDTVDFDRAQSHYEKGVLSIIFPKMESKKARRLNITEGRASERQTPESRTSEERPTDPMDRMNRP
jgi:HSP20 family protein